MEADISSQAVGLASSADFSLINLFLKADVIVKAVIISEKDASRTKAIEIFPYFSSNLAKKKDSNKADAILIASFYYETFRNED